MYAPIEIAAIVGRRTYDRGRAYADQGLAEVIEHSHEGNGPHVIGTCQGTASTPYFVDVHYNLSKNSVISRVEGRCTCPVGWNCKHAVAVLIEALHEQRIGSTQQSVPDWKRQLDNIFPTASPRDPLALVFDYQIVESSTTTQPLGRGWWNAPRRRDSLLITPMRPGKKKPWIVTGASWSEIRANVGVGLDRGQLAALNEVGQLWEVSNRTGGTLKWLPLTSIDSPLLFSVLQNVSDSGVKLLDSETFAPVNLCATPGSARIAIRENPSGIVNVKAELSHPDLKREERFIRIGNPPHAIAWKRDHQLYLARLDPAASREWAWLDREAGGITVPSSDRESFEKQALPHISQVGWVSPDDSFVPEPPPPPILHLDLLMTPAGTIGSKPLAQLAWYWQYGEDRKEQLFQVGRDSTRDDAAEVILLSDAQNAMKLVREDLLIQAEQTIEGLDMVFFLEKTVPELRDQGVKITSAEAPTFRRAQTSSVRIQTTPQEGTDWLDLQLTMNVDGSEVPMAALVTALTEKETTLFLADGTYVELDNPELNNLRRLLEEAQAMTDGRRRGVQVPRVRSTWWEDLAELEIVDVETDSWLDAVQRAVRNPVEPAELPRGLEATLRPYQTTGFRWLAGLRRNGLGGVLADDMGLGKTVQTLAMIMEERETNAERSGLWLVVAPTSVVANWKMEAERFAPSLRVATVDSTAKKRGYSLFQAAQGVDVLVTSYTLLRLEAEDYTALPVVGMVLDEAQQAKNPASRTFGSLVRVGAPVVYAITGTPMENNLGELWAMFALTVPGLLGSRQQFTKMYRRPIEKNNDDAAELMRQLQRRISPFLLRRHKDEVAQDLPPKQEQILTVDLAPSHRRLYDRQLQRERQRVLHLAADIDRNRIEVLSALTRLRQLSIDASLVDEDARVPSSKIDALIPLLHEAVAEKHRVLIFSQFTRYLRLISERLRAEGIDFSYLDGSTTDRGQVIEDFSSGDNPVFLISLKAGGVGLNLTMADYVILMDPWWNPAVESQAIDRTHRIGQTNPVHVYRFVARGTIEEKVLSLQESKRRLFEGVVEGQDASAHTRGAPLSAEDLRILLE